ncbi:MAG: acylphosphatase [Candidatus Pacearchaeota archaeon]
MKTIKMLVSGTVQGVFFRKYVQEKAAELGLRGFCRNLDNGDLEVVVEGKDENTTKMIEIVKKGPPYAKIKEIQTQEIKHQGFEDFRVLKM